MASSPSLSIRLTGRQLWCCVAVFVLFIGSGAAFSAEKSDDFARTIKPIIFSRCVACHGPDEDSRQAGLRLDTQEGSRADLGGYAAINPGDPDDSELIWRIESDDPDTVMPPPGVGEPLSETERAAFRSWIESGADYQSHWSYEPVERPSVPAVNDGQWCRNPVDRFVLAKMEQAGLEPNAPAAKHHLARRLALDLTGLPPMERLRQWARSTSGDASKLLELIDAMLADPAYGERRAAIWLDLARYADSAGYADDPPRTIWAYRDYVIRSFAQAKPFDQFTVEQLAGDLLPDPQSSQLVATAMHRNTPTNSEGGTDDEEFRNAAIVDRVNTTMAVWMGTTFGCAQCHTHKYDPITQEEYFRLFAIFNNTADSDKKDESPVIPVFDSEVQSQRERLRAELARLKRTNKTATPPLDGTLAAEFAAWKAKLAGDQGAPGKAQFVRVDIPNRKAILSLAEVEVIAEEKNVAADGKATQSSTDYEGAARLAIDGNTDGDYFAASSTTHTTQERGPWWQVQFKEPVAIERVVVWNRTDGGTGSRLHDWRLQLLDQDQHVIWEKEFEAPPAPQTAIDVRKTSDSLHSLLARAREQGDTQAEAELRHRFLEEQIESVERRLESLKPATTVPVMEELDNEDRRKTFIQIRGNFLDLGKEVTAGLPSAFHPLDEPQPTRLDLAHWIVDRENPLTARVVANRIWEQMFGVGLVATSEDFGSQGALPTHPDLLDWLAAELIAHDWDVKHLIRTIATSATYQQSALVTEERFQQDPNNRYLTRGPRFRVSAEMVRDQALAISGLLSRAMFGPPVHPPRPVLGLKAAFGGSTDWTDSQGGDRYRRAVYTEWRRSMPYPSMATFDVPSREVCTVHRIRTNTPLQALVTLNDPVYVEAARGLAARILRRDLANDRRRAAWALQLVLIREPTSAEIDHLIEVLRESRDHYQTHADEAKKLVGEQSAAFAVPVDTSELASWTVVANVLLNLDELLQKP